MMFEEEIIEHSPKVKILNTLHHSSPFSSTAIKTIALIFHIGDGSLCIINDGVLFVFYYM